MSQAVIGNLRVDLGLNTAQFDAGAKKAQSSLAGLSNSIKGFAAGIAGALTLGGVATVLQTSINRMDELGKAAQKIGIPVEELSKLEYAARLADVPLESLTTTMARFSRALSEVAAGGTSDAGAALQRIGVSATNAQGQLRPTAEIIADVAEEFSAMQDGADKTALAIQLFGRSGAELIPLLNGGRQAIADAGAELQHFGGVVTPEAARQAEQFNDNLTRMNAAWQGLVQQIGMEVLPVMAELTEYLLEWVKTGEPVGEWINSLSSWFSELAPFIATTRKEIEMITRALQNLGLVESKTSLPSGTLERILPGDVKATADMLDSMLGSIDRGSVSATPGKTSVPSIPKTGATTHPLLIPQIPPGTIDDIYGAGEAVRTLSTEIETANSYADNLARSISDGLAMSLTDIAFNAKSAGEAMDMLKASALDMLQGLTDQLLRSGLNMLLGGLMPGGGGLGGLLGSFGGFYANGGTLGAGKWGIAGEAGPEIIHGPARVTPMEGRGGIVVKNNVINNSSAQVQTRATQNNDGSIDIDTFVEDKVIDALGGGRAARVMGGRYGARIMPRRT
jgi:hypothetical protein